MDNTVYILDAYALIYRAYYALISHPLTDSAGRNISALVIFFSNLRSLLVKHQPQFLAAAFDSRVKTFRHELYPQYKATRAKTPDDLHAQVPMIEEALEALGVSTLRCDGYEADDVIACVAKKCDEEGRGCRILSADKDLLQLVSPTCKAMRPDKEAGGWRTLGEEDVVRERGVRPDQILDYLSLTGDAADNVPGVAGVGEKTAVKLLTQWGSLDEVYEHADEIKGALGAKVRAGRDSAYFSQKLIRLCDSVPLEIDLAAFSTERLDFASAARVLERLEAFDMAKKFDALKSAALSGTPFDEASEAQELPHQEEAAHEEAAQEEAGHSTVKQNAGHYTACDSVESLARFVDEVLSSEARVVAFDTETDSLDSLRAHIAGFSLSFKAGEGVYVPLVLNSGGAVLDKAGCFGELFRLFARADVTVVMHNGKFDLEVLRANGFALANGFAHAINCRLFDTMVAAWLLSPDARGKSPYSLETLAEGKLGIRGVEFADIVGKGKVFADVSLDVAANYAAEDADFTLQLYEVLRGELSAAALESFFWDVEMRVMPILMSMEVRGIHLDKGCLVDYGKELAGLIRQKEEEIYEEAGCTFNVASPKQLQAILFEKRGLPHGKKTKTGYSTDTAVLEELSKTTLDPLPALILEWRSYAKLQGTYVETLPGLADEKGRVHTSFLQTGTATGRLSSRDPNLQNIPVREEAGRRIRAAFTAEEGCVLISADYAQIELVVLAHLSGDENLCRAFHEGVDVHRSTAALIYRVPQEEVSAKQRRFAKTVNFGVMYGMSSFRLARDLGVSRHEAQEFIDRYFETYAGVRRFIEDVKEAAHKNGFVETITHRRRHIEGIDSPNKTIAQAAERIAVNTPIQGSAADIVKTAMVKVSDALASSCPDAQMLLQVHDELIFECPQDQASSAIDVIRHEMEGAVVLRVPLRVSVECAKSWGEFH